ncbi:histone-lysine N-methyltransferase SETMAR [Trichonephila clavipes]|nr:histone-lysine N-methyltransferase SETMAR [Trichonephila clavipes]
MIQHVKRKHPLLRNGFLLHHDNVRPHIARCVLDVSQQNTHNVGILPHPPYSPDFTPCDFWLFPQLRKLCKQQSMCKGGGSNFEKALTKRTLTCFKK